MSRPSDQVNLRDIFRAVQEESIFSMPRQEPSAECPVGLWLPSVLVSCFSEAESALLDRLALVSIADVVESVKAECSCNWEPGMQPEWIPETAFVPDAAAVMPAAAHLAALPGD